MVVGIVAYFLLPNNVETASFLKPDEQVFARARLQLDMPSRLAQDGSENQYESFKWPEVLRGVFSISTWLSASAYFGILAGLYSFGLFVSGCFPLSTPSNPNLASNYHCGTWLHCQRSPVVVRDTIRRRHSLHNRHLIYLRSTQTKRGGNALRSSPGHNWLCGNRQYQCPPSQSQIWHDDLDGDRIVC